MRRRDFVSAVLGGALAHSPARAQQSGRAYRLVIVSPAARPEDIGESGAIAHYRAFFQELRRLGYVEGKNLRAELRSGIGRPQQDYPEVAREAVQLQPDVIFVVTGHLAQLVLAETRTIPVVNVTSGDPTSRGVSESLSRPGANLTGVTTDAGWEIVGKRVELLREITPATTLAYLVPLGRWQGAIEAVQAAAQQASVTILPAIVGGRIDDEAYASAFLSMTAQGVQGLVVHEAPENLVARPAILRLAQQHRIPAIYPFREFAAGGGLVSYVVDLREVYRNGARQIDRLLRGAHPAEVPFVRPTEFELIINLKAAKALGLKIPDAFLARADEVIA
jgi:putative ABC transport system substrate-binding protein